MNIEILNHNAEKAIEYAYDTFDKEEFLTRLYDFIRSSVDTAIQIERLNELAYKNSRIMDKRKT